MSKRIAIVAGAGPGGLTAALELLRRTEVQPVVFEMSDCVGGLSRTVNYKGNRMDIGGHRFFSKSDWVMRWWQEILPVDHRGPDPLRISYHKQNREIEPAGAGEEAGDDVLLVRRRTSRIYHGGQFFTYPLRLNWDTLRKLGMRRAAKFAASYARARLMPIRPEESLEDFIVNRFGRQLYEAFFREYTEKVWGIPCGEISADWGAQRIKGLSVGRAVAHMFKRLLPWRRDSLKQKGTETSLIENFLYPKFGPGQMWRKVARRVRQRGGRIHFRSRVERVLLEGGRVAGVEVLDLDEGRRRRFECDYFVSTMPVRRLVASVEPQPPPDVRRVAKGLQYRDFITIGLLVPRLQGSSNGLLPDNWIYIQDRGVRLGRVQIFNNWSPHLVKDPDTVWAGLEYFCTQGDELWEMSDQQLLGLAQRELRQIGLLANDPVLEYHIERVPKAYPAYFGTFGEFDIIRRWSDSIPNLFLIGRNGMHRYNNQDHSMLTAKAAVDLIAAGETEKRPIWEVNIGDDYHEEMRRESE